MTNAASPVILIPARLGSTRLPNKPLADIQGVPMIVQVWRRAMEADIGPVFVAAAEPEIVAAVDSAGGRAVLTNPDHPSGSDRIFEALGQIDPVGRFDVVVNVQGDLPTIDPRVIIASVKPLEERVVDIVTLATVITREEEKTEPSVVKAIGSTIAPGRMRALYFTRSTAPSGEGPLYHHIGLYTYRRGALDRFVSLPPSPLEQRERLEQLRAVEDGMRIDIIVVDDVPLGVDTPHDLDRARAILKSRAGA